MLIVLCRLLETRMSLTRRVFEQILQYLETEICVRHMIYLRYHCCGIIRSTHSSLSVPKLKYHANTPFVIRVFTLSWTTDDVTVATRFGQANQRPPRYSATRHARVLPTLRRRRPFRARGTPGNMSCWTFARFDFGSGNDSLLHSVHDDYRTVRARGESDVE